MKSIIKKIFSEDFWYDDVSHSGNSVIDNKFELHNESKKDFMPIAHVAPQGYIDLILQGVDLDKLYANHRVTLSYIRHNDRDYVSTINLLRSSHTLECYSDGENESLTIHEENNSKLNIILKEKSGKLEIKQIINGKLIS